MQVICNKSLLFLDVYARWPGSVYDACIIRQSPIFNYLQDNPLPPTFCLLGDSAYQLTNTVLEPFRDNGHLTDFEKKYNRIHSSTRVEIQRDIELLKGKFRKLKFLDIPIIMVATCVLHNFIILNRGIVEEEVISVDNVCEYHDVDEVRPASSDNEKHLEIARATINHQGLLGHGILKEPLWCFCRSSFPFFRSAPSVTGVWIWGLCS